MRENPAAYRAVKCIVANQARRRRRGRIPEWLKGAVAGALIGVVGAAVFTVWWDRYKAREETIGRTKSLLSLASQETRANLVTLRSNQALLQADLEALGRAQFRVTPLEPLRTGMLESVLVTLEGKIGDLRRDLESPIDLTYRVHQSIREREKYRHSPIIDDPIAQGVTTSGKVLLKRTEDLMEQLTALESKLQAAIHSSRP